MPKIPPIPKGSPAARQIHALHGGRLKHPFEPVWAPDARVLILGSYPSRESVAGGGYYGARYADGKLRNDFWPLMADVLVEPRLLGPEPYGDWEDRYDTLSANRVALWDVVRSCERDGPSSDGAIRNARPNDVAGLIATGKTGRWAYARPDNGTDLERILFTGTRARDLFERLVMTREARTSHRDLWDEPHGHSVVLWTLPSPSRAHTMPYARKLELYRAAFQGLGV